MKLLILLLLINVYHISFAHEEDVYTIQYTAETFPLEVPNRNHFVMFFAPWCGHCKRLAPTWEQLAEMLNNDKDSNILIAKVDCTVDNSLCTDHDITGYPTLKFFKVGQAEGVKFKGTRDLPSLTSFINEQLGNDPPESELVKSNIPEPVNGLIELTEDTFDKFVAKGNHFIKFYAPWCGHCQKLAPTWEQLAQNFEKDTNVNIAKVDCTQFRSICNQFDVKGYPTLLWIEDGRKIEKYQGQRTHEDFKSYINKMLGSNEIASEDEAQKPEESPVKSLTTDNFNESIKNGLSFIKFFAPWCGHCKRLAPTWEELAKLYADNSGVNIMKVDCTLDAAKQLCSEQSVDGFPTLFLYKNGEKIDEYTGTRSIEDLQEFIKGYIQTKDEL